MKHRFLFALGLLLVCFLSLRFYQLKWLGYESIPALTIFDEIDYPFAGYTFKKTLIPTGWSTMDIYKTLDDQNSSPNISFNGLHLVSNDQLPGLSNFRAFNYPVTTVIDVDIGKGTETIRLVQPFFDHPVFGSWLFALPIDSITRFDDLTPAQFRIVPLYLSVLTGILLFIITFLAYRRLIPAFFSFFIYSVTPVYIFSSRYALFENILIPLSLLSLISLIIYLDYRPRPVFLLTSSFFAGLAFITKEQGIFILISLIAILAIRRQTRPKTLLLSLIPFLLLTTAYYSYAFYLAPQLMSRLLFDQANRGFFGSLNFINSIFFLNFDGFPKEGFWFFGILSLLILSYRRFSKHLYLAVPFLAYLITFIAFGGLNYSWYYLPFLPFSIIASALMLNQLLVKPNPVNLSLFFVLPFSSVFFWGFSQINPDTQVLTWYRLFFLALSSGYLVYTFLSSRIKQINLKPVWFIFIFFFLYLTYKWNRQSFYYLTANWKSLPEAHLVSKP